MPAESQELARITRLRRLIWLWPLTFVPVMLIVAWLMPHGLAAIIGIAVIWTIGFAVSVRRASAALCPRCGERFHGKRIIPNAHACGSCGLPLKRRHVVYPTLE
jgi:hypothetical protein